MPSVDLRIGGLLLAALFWTTGARAADGPKDAKERIPLTVGCAKLRISLPQFVAKEEGIFAKHGLEVTLQPFETAQPMILAQVGGRLDVAGHAALAISIPAAASGGAPLLFGTMMLETQKNPFSFLIVKKDSAIQDVAGLKDRKVGILPAVAFKEMLKAILAKNGVPAESVTIQNINPPMQGAALASGSVDAIFTPDPAATAIVASGVGRLMEPRRPSPVAAYLRDPYPFAAATVTKAFYEKNPEAVRRYFAALDEAISRIAADPVKANRHMRPYISEEMRPFVGKYYPSYYVGTAAAKPELFQEAADACQRWGLVPQGFEMRPHLYRGEAAAAER